jgi:HK97 family phage portal protein
MGVLQRITSEVGRYAKAAVAPLSSLYGSNSSARPVNGGWGWLREPNAGAWQRGAKPDSPDELTGIGAVYACLSLVSGDAGKLCPRVMKKRDDGTRVPVENSPFLIPLLEPNDYETRNQFFERWILAKLTFGNTYIFKQRDQRGIVNYLHVLDSRRVTPLVTPDGDVYYSLGGDDLSKLHGGMVVPARDIIHDRAKALWHPLVGVPPLYAAGMSATQARRIQGNSSLFFENMSRPSGMLMVPGTVKPEEAARLKRDWEANYSGNSMGRMAVLTGGMTYQAMTIPAEQAQLIDQLKWTAVDICAPFHVPPYKIGIGNMPTNNNVEALGQQYYETALQPLIEHMESLLNKGLSIPSGQSVEFDLDGLMRMDSKTLADVESIKVQRGISAINESRLKFNLPPVDGGNVPMLQEQNWPLKLLAERTLPAETTAAAPKPDTPPAEDAKALADALIDRVVAKQFEPIRAEIASAMDAANKKVAEADDMAQAMEAAMFLSEAFKTLEPPEYA